MTLSTSSWHSFIGTHSFHHTNTLQRTYLETTTFSTISHFVLQKENIIHQIHSLCCKYAKSETRERRHTVKKGNEQQGDQIQMFYPVAIETVIPGTTRRSNRLRRLENEPTISLVTYLFQQLSMAFQILNVCVLAWLYAG